MPTIDELAPATAAADTDQLVVSQAGLTRRLSRAQVVAGLQPELSIPSGRLVGRSSTGSGPVETISLGANLTLANGTLTAASTPFVVSQLPSGVVPNTTDLIPILQGGTTVAVTYGQFQNSLGRVSNVDVSQALVTPTGGTTSRRLADIAQTMLNASGGTMTGPLTLSGPPALGSQAATKDYVDSSTSAALPRSGGTLSGPLTLSGDPSLTSHAATKAYVDSQVGTALPRSGGTLTGALTLNGDPIAVAQAATKQYVDARVARAGDTLTGPLTLASVPTSALHAATKSYVDIQIQSTLPLAGGTLSGALILAGDPSSARQAATKSYVDAHSGTGLTPSGGTMTGALVLAADPATAFQAATKQYVDAKVSRSGDTLTGPLVLAADPTTGAQAATKSYVDSVATVSGSLLRTGGTLTGPLTLSGDPTTTTQAATKRYVDAQVATALPQTGGTISGALTLSAAPTAAGHAANKQYVDSQVATAVPLSGGTVSGPLSLSAMPTASIHAVPKQYVDGIVGTYGLNVKLAPYSAPLNGSADDTPAFKAAYAAASSNAVIHVPNGTAILQDCGSWGVSLTKPVKWVLDGTVRADGTALASAVPTGTNPASANLPGVVQGHSSSGVEFSRSTSSATDLAVLHSSYVVGHAGGSSAVIANARTDTLIYNSPANFVWAGLDRLIWTGIQAPSRTSLVQHVGRYIQTIRQTTTTDSNGAPLPQPELWAACLEYRDVTNKPSSAAAAAITVEMDWVGNGADDAGNRQIQSLVVGQNDPAGPAVEVANVIGVYLAAGSKGKTQRVFNIGIPFQTAVLDTTAATQLAGAAAIRLAAGHTIAFDPSANNTLAFDSATGTLRWNQGTLSYPVGKGICVGWANVCSGNTTLPNYLTGNIVFLIGSSTFTITLPPAATTPAGTGFTFSTLGNCVVSIVTSGGDIIDNGPVVLRQSDRYHVVSDGSFAWREVFRTNSVSPRFTGPPVLPTYTVASLPSSQPAGAKAFATNGRKPNEGGGGGSGVEVFYDGSRWISVCSGSQVVA